jgi:hypothetical protein
MRISTQSLNFLFKVDLIVLFFVNLILDVFDPLCPFGSLRLISYGGTGAAMAFSLLFRI